MQPRVGVMLGGQLAFVRYSSSPMAGGISKIGRIEDGVRRTPACNGWPVILDLCSLF
jgi:hypothetical protein